MVKYIIQNLAVYGYVYQSNSWQIVSWMPQVANLIPNEVKADNNIFTQTEQITNEVTQKVTNNTFNIPPLSLNNVQFIPDNYPCFESPLCLKFGFPDGSDSEGSA